MADYLEVWGPAGVDVITLEGQAVMVGRDPSNQIVLAHDPEVSRRIRAAVYDLASAAVRPIADKAAGALMS